MKLKTDADYTKAELSNIFDIELEDIKTKYKECDDKYNNVINHRVIECSLTIANSILEMTNSKLLEAILEYEIKNNDLLTKLSISYITQNKNIQDINEFISISTFILL